MVSKVAGPPIHSNAATNQQQVTDTSRSQLQQTEELKILERQNVLSYHTDDLYGKIFHLNNKNSVKISYVYNNKHIRTSLYAEICNIYLLITGVSAQISHSRENSVPPTVQATHGTNISNIEVSFIALLLLSNKNIKIIVIIKMQSIIVIIIIYYDLFFDIAARKRREIYSSYTE